MAVSNPFASLFGTSPIKPLQQHMAAAVVCAEKLNEFFAATFAADWATAEELFKEISAAEHEADRINKEFRMNMPKSLFMPVSRGDLLSIIGIQDDIADHAKDIAGIILGRQLQVPNALQKKFASFVAESGIACSKALTAVNELDELLETGFAGQEVKFVEKLIRDLDKQEQRVDKGEKTLRHRLFALESEMNPIDAMFLYSTIDNIGALADFAKAIGNRLELLMAK